MRQYVVVNICYNIIMKIIIAGSRTITNINILIEAIKQSEFKINSNDEIVSGGAKGVDSLGEEYAKQNNIKVIVFKPDWNRYGIKAGVIRNSQMAQYADCAIVVHCGSKGSIDMVNKMKRVGKKVFEYKINE